MIPRPTGDFNHTFLFVVDAVRGESPNGLVKALTPF